MSFHFYAFSPGFGLPLSLILDEVYFEGLQMQTMNQSSKAESINCMQPMESSWSFSAVCLLSFPHVLQNISLSVATSFLLFWFCFESGDNTGGRLPTVPYNLHLHGVTIEVIEEARNDEDSSFDKDLEANSWIRVDPCFDFTFSVVIRTIEFLVTYFIG